MVPPYQKTGLILARDQSNDPVLVRALQHDLRSLGYLRRGIDGVFGDGTARAVRSLRYDLLHNDGGGGDGRAPVAVNGYNRGRVGATITSELDQPLAACIADMLADAAFPRLPFSADPNGANKQAMAAIARARSDVAPTPFVLAIVSRESNGAHYAVPRGADQDDFVVVGFDRAKGAPPDQITSRGYGIGQYTLKHHPPGEAELRQYIIDPVGGASLVYHVLRDKLALAVGSPDRRTEHPGQPARLCRYATGDPRYLTDCLGCARQVRKLDIKPGTPFYLGAPGTYQPTTYHPTARYSGVPDRAEFLCDWPYAVRRYNGDGADSYHYQAEVLPRLLNPPVVVAAPEQKPA